MWGWVVDEKMIKNKNKKKQAEQHFLCELWHLHLLWPIRKLHLIQRVLGFAQKSLISPGFFVVVCSFFCLFVCFKFFILTDVKATSLKSLKVLGLIAVVHMPTMQEVQV